jgi:type I restriction enzyme R subunit
MSQFTESVVEDATLEWLEGLGYTVLHGPEIASGEPAGERDDSGYHDVILERRLREALLRLNPKLPLEALRDAYKRLTVANEPSIVTCNHASHQFLVEGITVEYTRPDGSVGGALAHVIDFDHPDNNDWVAVNQFTVVEGQNNRRPDVLIFLNGLPIVLLELKNPADENATIWNAFDQIQTYKAQISSLFTYNELLIISDGLEARVGSLTATTERFMPWRTIGAKRWRRRRCLSSRSCCRACSTNADCWTSSATS